MKWSEPGMLKYESTQCFSPVVYREVTNAGCVSFAVSRYLNDLATAKLIWRLLLILLWTINKIRNIFFFFFNARTLNHPGMDPVTSVKQQTQSLVIAYIFTHSWNMQREELCHAQCIHRQLYLRVRLLIFFFFFFFFFFFLGGGECKQTLGKQYILEFKNDWKLR